MKRIYTLLAGFMLFGAFTSKGQDTLMYESFNYQSFYDYYFIKDVIPPPGVATDTMWYSFDADGLPDGAPGGTREGGWYPVRPYADVDTAGNVALGASSWFPTPAAASNWLITPNVLLGEHDTLFWKSAPSQTPRYCDGYQVLISTTDNSDLSFKDTLFTAAEMTQISSVPGDSAIFANHTFSSPGFIHGFDGTYIEANPGRPTGAFQGILHPFSAPLDAYPNQNVFIAIHHNSFDDIMIRGTKNSAAGIKENKMDLNLNVFPNPANQNEFAQLNFELTALASVTIFVNDVTGKLVYSDNKGSLAQGRHFAAINTSALAKGFYTIGVQTNNVRSTAKLIVQ